MTAEPELLDLLLHPLSSKKAVFLMGVQAAISKSDFVGTVMAAQIMVDAARVPDDAIPANWGQIYDMLWDFISWKMERVGVWPKWYKKEWIRQ